LDGSEIHLINSQSFHKYLTILLTINTLGHNHSYTIEKASPVGTLRRGSEDNYV